MDHAELADRLLRAAQRRARKHRLNFGQGADHDIRQFADTAARKILTDHPPSGLDENEIVRQAEAAFEKLVDEMVRAADEIAGYRAEHPEIIGEQTLARALARLCPLFPIC